MTEMHINIQKKSFPSIDDNPDHLTISGLEFSLNSNEFVCLVGPSGCGKTTLLNIIAGLDQNYQGSILSGQQHTPPKIGYVFQNPDHQIFSEHVYDEIAFGPRLRKVPEAEIDRRVEEALGAVGLTGFEQEDPFSLTKSGRQRVAVASILAVQPDVLILDEPTSMLDPVSRGRIFDVLAKIKEDKKNTVIVIEHSLEHLLPLTDRMVLMYDSELLLEDETNAFFEKTDFLLEKGVFPPGVIQFFHELRLRGQYSGKYPLTVSDASKALKKLMGS